MRRLDLTLDEPADNLALDEALLISAEQGGEEVIRFWRFLSPAVILGRGSKIREEVDIDYCETHGIPFLRRCSGGASVVAGPHCWMYSVVLDLNLRPALRNVDLAHQFVISRLAKAVQAQRPEVQWQGICDLTLGDRKFSGNSLRVARHHLLYHGTVLEQADHGLISRCLRQPPRQPDYRAGRSHDEFITSIAIDPVGLCDALAKEYDAHQNLNDWPSDQMRFLSGSKYNVREWTWRH
ncbi:MAG: lipoate--protein ligase family protein [Planctomycetaceae bacterium]